DQTAPRPAGARRHASLGLGPALPRTARHHARLPDLRCAARDATGARGSARAARTLPGTPDGRGSALRGAAHREGGSARSASRRSSAGSIAPRHRVGPAATAQRDFTGIAGSWQRLQADLAALNATLRAAKLAPIHAELPPPRDLNAADED